MSYHWLYSVDSDIYIVGIEDNNRVVVVKMDNTGKKGPATSVPATWINKHTE